jgi:hypothetical protein
VREHTSEFRTLRVPLDSAPCRLPTWLGRNALRAELFRAMHRGGGEQKKRPREGPEVMPHPAKWGQTAGGLEVCSTLSGGKGSSHSALA